MSQNIHQWVEDFREFEAVLVCTNALPTWDDPGSIMRAFQTNLWHQTAQKDEQQYSHSETGVVIRQDGNVVAIEFGDENLSEAFPDLFRTLHSLGWEHADVYHPAETLDILLMEMGRAIPANMGFDVHPAKLSEDIAMTSEGRHILAQSVQDFGGAVNKQSLSDSSSLIDSMFATVDSRVKANQDDLPPKNPVIRLDDDEPLIPFDTAELNITTSGVPYTQNQQIDLPPKNIEAPASYAFMHAEPEEPFVFSVEGIGEAIPLPSPADFISIEVIPDEIPPSSNSALPVIDSSESVRDITPVHSADELGKQGVGSAARAEPLEMGREVLSHTAEPFVHDEGVRSVDVSRLFLMDTVEYRKLIKVGNSAFCFDFPSNPIDPDEFADFVTGCGFELGDVVRLYPGEMNEPLRWDFMSELSAEFPWFVDKLAGVMFLSVNRTISASILLALKKDRELCQLRDVLSLVKTEHEVIKVVETVMPEVADCFAAAVWNGDLKQAMREIYLALGGLLLAPAGTAFIDVKDGVHSDLAYESFSVKSIINSDEKRLYVVHVDEMDGPFTLWIAQLLMCVAYSHSKSKRRARVTVGVESVEVSEQPVENQGNMAAAVLLAEMITKFRALGIELPKA